ncbi:hypothetical protein [Nostoc sp. CCY0012]|uniref:hypothetical protein n=1 Tax=Nostoc sp. CCY0012 TaxID=1056123 RepID=UPI0039C72930
MANASISFAFLDIALANTSTFALSKNTHRYTTPLPQSANISRDAKSCKDLQRNVFSGMKQMYVYQTDKNRVLSCLDTKKV